MSGQADRGGRRVRVDFLTGTPWKKILVFTVPLLLGNLFQQLYNTVDTMIVGRGVSHVALAAVGLGGPLLRIIVALFMGVATGSSVLVSQYFGAKNEELLRRTLHTSLVLALSVGLVLSAVGYAFVPNILRLMNTPDDVFPMAVTYLRILFSGMIWQLMYNMLAGFMRGIGNSRSPLIILIISSFTNAILTYIFVFPMQMGVAGSAYGTIIAQLVSGVLVLFFLNRSNPLTRIKLKELRLDKETAKEILTLGLPTAIQQAAMSVGNIIIMGFINTYGTATIAGYATAMRVDMFVFQPIMSLNMAMTSYTGQNVGAAQMDRVYLGVKQGLSLSVILNITLSSILLIFCRPILALFTDNAETIAEATKCLFIIVPSYVLMAISQPLGGVMRGSGETVIPMINSLMTIIIVRIPLVILFNHLFGRIEGVYYSQVVSQILGFAHLLVLYRIGKWKNKALQKIESLQSGESVETERDLLMDME